ncbi:hypothetical protein Gotur_022875 [Gossypium turneri]
MISLEKSLTLHVGGTKQNLDLDLSANKKGLNFLRVNFHFNPTFNDPVESMVELNSDVLDPRKHLAIIFKEIKVPEIVKPNRGADSTRRGKGIPISKGRGSEVKGGTCCSGGTINIVGLFEIRVSGGKANSIIASLGFQYSHRVEAIGFLKVFGLDGRSRFGPDSCKRRRLWDALKATILDNGSPCVAVGNFNVHLASNKKKGGRVRGAPFTWHRAGVYDRLNRAIRNDV